ncbi:MAG: endonuclease domain-containing protein [Anaerolineales bacterium]|nr:endonuclease domain-containing protein [Chloroflexota bacterium]MBL6981355.1 endonuclease domain-containing protein [Anaerolineales bacterium]
MGKKNIITGQKIKPEKLARAKELRRNMTPAERRLWGKLRANRLGGWHFRRQQVIDGYIVDFYCHKARLVIEVDGPIHYKQKKEDARRSKVLSARELKILRFTNGAVMNDLDRVLDEILEEIEPDSPFLEERG